MGAGGSRWAVSQPTGTAEVRYAELAGTRARVSLLGTPGVTVGVPGKRGFGSGAGYPRAGVAGGKIFAMLSGGRLVVKLSRQRVDALIASGDGQRFDPRRDGRPMKEWLSLEPASEEDWLPLATPVRGYPALAFVSVGR